MTWPLAVLWTILLVGIASGASACIVGARERNVEWRELLGFAVLAAISCYPWMDTYFHGMEYEDAYEYAAGGLLLLEGVDVDSFLNPGCWVGSLRGCEQHATLSHPAGYSALVAAAYAAFGFTQTVANNVSLACSVITIVALYLVAANLTSSKAYPRACAMAWMLTPGLIVGSSTSFSEPFSGLLIALSSLAFLQCLAPHRVTATRIACLAALLLLSVTVRRENALLLIAFPTAAVVMAAASPTRERTCSARWIFAASMSVAAVLYVCFPSVLFLPGPVHPSAPDFSLENFLPLAAGMLGEWFSPAYILFVPMLLASTPYIVRRPRHLALLGALLCYLLLFTTFSQTYDYVQSGVIPTQHIRRYTQEIAPLICLFLGVGLVTCLRGLRRCERRTAVVLYALCWLSAAGLGWQLRSTASADERRERLFPVESACDRIPAGATLVSSESIVAMLRCPQHRIVAYEVLGTAVPTASIDQHADEAFYLARFERDPENLRSESARQVVEQRIVEELDFPARSKESQLFRLNRVRKE